MGHVLTLGEAMVLLYPDEPVSLAQGKQVLLGVAGAESNAAIQLSRLGHHVRFISRVGDDPFGQRIRATLQAEGVDTVGLLIDHAARTGIFFREWLPDGQRRVWYYRSSSAASRLAPEDLRPEWFAGASVVHLSGITPALSASCAATVERAIQLAHEAGATVAFDPNYRAALWDESTARAALLPLLAQVDILLMGHEDSLALLGSADEEDVLRRGRELGAGIVVLKQAERGATALEGRTRVSVAAHQVARVIDPVGAGDAFDAGFLSGWLRGQSLEQALQLGAEIAAATVGVSGDYPARTVIAQPGQDDS